MVDNDRAHPETSLDVDLMILDYFLCSSIRAVLHDRDAQRRDGIYSENTQRLLTTFTGKSYWTKEKKRRLSIFFIGGHLTREDQIYKPV